MQNLYRLYIRADNCYVNLLLDFTCNVASFCMLPYVPRRLGSFTEYVNIPGIAERPVSPCVGDFLYNFQFLKTFHNGRYGCRPQAGQLHAFAMEMSGFCKRAW